MEATSSTQAANALSNWEWQNDVVELAQDDIYYFDEVEQQRVLHAKPWQKDPHFFQQVKISALALLKMVMHARSGGRIEVMGLMLGKVEMGVMWVFDAFELPVEGTETRVNAQTEAYEYMAQYIEAAQKVGRQEKVIGWYHTHPGYGCWLSGIDVNTQMINQQYQEPWLAVVIDPIRTISAGRVSLGAFRTYPKGYRPPDEPEDEFETVPMNKIEDFGVHCKQYYSLHVSYFKSERDDALIERLWNRYWIKTLSTTAWIARSAYNLDRMRDAGKKLADATSSMHRFPSFAQMSRSMRGPAAGPSPLLTSPATEVQQVANPSGVGDAAMRKIRKADRDARRISCEASSHAVIEIAKKRLFYHWATGGKEGSSAFHAGDGMDISCSEPTTLVAVEAVVSGTEDEPMNDERSKTPTAAMT